MAYFTMKVFSYSILPSLVATLCFLMNAWPLHAQLKVGNRPASHHKAAVLELESGSQGLLLTRVADTNSVNLFSPPDGMIIYFTDEIAPVTKNINAGLYERRNGKWERSRIVIDTIVDDSDFGIRFLYNNGKYTLRIPNAGAGLRGLMSTGRQSFTGRKTFNDSIVLQNVHPGSVIFVRDAPTTVNNSLTDNNSEFFWNNLKERLGIGTNNPSAKLDVHGNFKLGEKGSILNSIIRDSMSTIAPISLNTGEGYLYSFPVVNVKAGANVMISPAENLSDGCIIAYSYSTAGAIHIRIENIKDITIPASTKFYVTVIQ